MPCPSLKLNKKNTDMFKREKVRFSLFIAGFFILNLFYCIRNSRADYIYLKDGSIISGVLIEKTEKLFIYRGEYGEMFINRENISKIIPESKDKPLIREAEKYLNDKEFERAIKTCGEVLEIDPNNIEALKLKQKVITAWRKYEAEREERIRRQTEEREQMARELEKLEIALKTKYGIAIRKEKNNYVISDIYYNCPLTKGGIKPHDILIAVHNTEVAKFPIKKLYDLLLTLKKINLTIQRPVVLIREKILWQGTKEYVGLGISIEKVDKGIKITNLMPDGPAVKAGLLKDDMIINLNGYTISSASMDDIVKMLKGSAGTGLKTIIERDIILD